MKKLNLHRDYIPYSVLSHKTSAQLSGAITKVRFVKVENMSLCEELRLIIGIYKYKDVYFWLPYKHVIDKSAKYSVIGPASRFPFANQWFEIKEQNSIYKQGLKTITLESLLNDLLIVTRKVVIRYLDENLFKSK